MIMILMRQNVSSALANFRILQDPFVYPTMGIFSTINPTWGGRGPVWFLKDSLKLPILVWNKRDQTMQMHSELEGDRAFSSALFGLESRFLLTQKVVAKGRKVQDHLKEIDQLVFVQSRFFFQFPLVLRYTAVSTPGGATQISARTGSSQPSER